MKYQVRFIMDSNLTDDYKSSLKDYLWWVSIVPKVCESADNFEIRCWSYEEEAIRTGQKYGKAVKNTESAEVVFKGKITSEFVNEITSNYLDSQNSLKWFTIIFYMDTTMLFASEHYGSEPYLFQLSKEDLQELKKWVKQYSCILGLHIYENISKEFA